MEEGRKRVLGIMASILVARHLKTTEDLHDSRPSPRTESLVGSAVQWAERVMRRIDGTFANYFRGQVAIVIPDFRARISKLTIALSCLKADFECRFINPDEMIVKAYAENSQGCILQKTIRLENSSLEVELTGMPSLASIVLMCSSTRETLDRRSFQANISWHEPGVLVDIPKDEIEQILLAGEGETIEFKEKLDKGRPERVARTVTAFANTKGGTIVFGVDDDHQLVGCPTQGMADTITNIVRSYCDPPPVFATTVVNHQGKSLLLLRVMESPESVHTVKDQGPFIRANGTNRAPTSYELEILFRRRSGSNPLTRVLYGS